MTGRVKTYEAIVKGHNVPKPGVPESFKVLVKELQSLCLDIRVLDEFGGEIELREEEDDDMGYAGSKETYISNDAEVENAGFAIADAEDALDGAPQDNGNGFAMLDNDNDDSDSDNNDSVVADDSDMNNEADTDMNNEADTDMNNEADTDMNDESNNDQDVVADEEM